MNYLCKISSPLGGLTVSSDGECITGLWNEGQKYFAATLDVGAAQEHVPVFDDVRAWLGEYFAGKKPGFMPPLAPKGSEFRQLVWKILCEIPHGTVTTYGDIAKRLKEMTGGKPVSAQAVGGAVGHNPISILIPCHRVVGASGSLTGYAGGIDKKIRLLQLEGAPMEGLFAPAKGTAL